MVLHSQQSGTGGTGGTGGIATTSGEASSLEQLRPHGWTPNYKLPYPIDTDTVRSTPELVEWAMSIVDNHKHEKSGDIISRLDDLTTRIGDHMKEVQALLDKPVAAVYSLGFAQEDKSATVIPEDEWGDFNFKISAAMSASSERSHPSRKIVANNGTGFDLYKVKKILQKDPSEGDDDDSTTDSGSDSGDNGKASKSAKMWMPGALRYHDYRWPNEPKESARKKAPNQFDDMDDADLYKVVLISQGHRYGNSPNISNNDMMDLLDQYIKVSPGPGPMPHILYDPWGGKFMQMIPADKAAKVMCPKGQNSHGTHVITVMIMNVDETHPFSDSPMENWDEFLSWIEDLGIPNKTDVNWAKPVYDQKRFDRNGFFSLAHTDDTTKSSNGNCHGGYVLSQHRMSDKEDVKKILGRGKTTKTSNPNTRGINHRDTPHVRADAADRNADVKWVRFKQNPKVLDMPSMRKVAGVQARQAAYCAWATWGKFLEVISTRSNDTYSEHPCGGAIDIMGCSSGCDLKSSYPHRHKVFETEMATYFMKYYKSWRVCRMIYQQRIWANYDKFNAWRGMGDRGGNTANHRDHLHLLTSVERCRFPGSGTSAVTECKSGLPSFDKYSFLHPAPERLARRNKPPEYVTFRTKDDKSIKDTTPDKGKMIPQWDDAIDKMKKYADGLPSNVKVGVSVWNAKTNKYIGGFNKDNKVKIASMIKLLYLGAFLDYNGVPSDGEAKGKCRGMITTSDDDHSVWVREHVGSGSDGSNWNTFVNKWVRKSLDWDGISLPVSSPRAYKVSANEMAKAMALFLESLEKDPRRYALSLLDSITSSSGTWSNGKPYGPQDWGMIAAAKAAKWEWWTKAGWLGDSASGNACMSQVGLYKEPNSKKRVAVCITIEWTSGGPSESDIDTNGNTSKGAEYLEKLGDILFAVEIKEIKAPGSGSTPPDEEFVVVTKPQGQFALTILTNDALGKTEMIDDLSLPAGYNSVSDPPLTGFPDLDPVV
jgi:hypothetical protein